MIELTWGQIRDQELSIALNGLARQRVEYKTTLKLLTITKEVEAQQKKAQGVAEALRDKYMKLDDEKKFYVIRDPTSEDALKKEEQEFMNTKFKIRIPKLKSGELIETKMTAVELFKLEPLIEMEVENKPPLKAVEETV